MKKRADELENGDKISLTRRKKDVGKVIFSRYTHTANGVEYSVRTTRGEKFFRAHKKFEIYE